MINHIKHFINIRVRRHLRFRNYIPGFKFGRVFTEILLEHMEPFYYMDEWSMKPFNGQAKRLIQISLIANELKPNYAIETGTYLGTSTIYLAGMVTERTYTIEIDKNNALNAKKRFEKNNPNLNICCIVGDSVNELTNILNIIPKERMVIAYLDSHWFDKIPTSGEIEELYSWGENWIAVIDDFKVDKDPGYGFDIYGEVEISISVVPNLPGLQVWVPIESSTHETGARRGTGYVFTKKTIELMTPKVLQNLNRVR